MNEPVKVLAPLTWNPASMQLPEMPPIQPGEDAMSMTIAGILPTLATSLTTNVTALSAKENMFNAKLSDAQAPTRRPTSPAVRASASSAR
ncbi:hypothetical protein BN970_06016 [Mycolicibacterium conceptionense]|uniref:PPE family protein n=1 Tax=Mycolicibacterium conceptionense TaxID=451644 RepID=A0A0U1DZ83_9MYCO|nr:hypothetical protein BN970_06016 [Mycolicibacterium conceptionense]